MKFNLSKITSFAQHRSGWSYAMENLRLYHSNAGIFIDDFIEKTFSWDLNLYYLNSNSNNIPYTFPWIGILHNPPNVPQWFYHNHHPTSILNRDIFKQSLKKCKCLVVLSDYLAGWLRQRVSVPVVSVRHPTELATKQWDYYKFLKGEKRIVQLGYWLRDFDSICRISAPNGYKKYLMPSDRGTYDMLVKHMEANSPYSCYEVKNKWANTQILDRLSNIEFDDILSSSIIYLNLYDSSANNAIIECIARSTPIIVNKIPAVVEYLGPDYPLYFSGESEVASLLFNNKLIYDAHNYLKFMDKHWLSGAFFAKDFHDKVDKCLM